MFYRSLRLSSSGRRNVEIISVIYSALLGLDNLSSTADGAVSFAGITLPVNGNLIRENRAILQTWWDGRMPWRPVILAQPEAGAELRAVTGLVPVEC